MNFLKNIGVHFFVRTERKDSKGNAPIYLRLIRSNQRLVIRTNRKVAPQNWNSKKEMVIGDDGLTHTINQYLELIKMRVYEIINLYSIQKKPYTLYTIKDLIFEQSNYIKEKSLLQAAKLHNEEMKTLLGYKYCYKTYQYYVTTSGFLEKFLKKVYKRNDIQLEELDLTFARKFENWVLINTKSTNNGMAKHIQRLKKIINWSIREGWIKTNPIQTYRVTFHKFDRGYLTEEEISLLERANLTNIPLISVRQQFVFQIYTGLAHSDLNTLEWKHVLNNHEGNDWIMKPREKTKTLTTVPLLPKSKEILRDRKQVANDGLIFKISTNQVYNRQLKALAREIGLKKRLTSHLARHTFATTITLSKGIPIETVSKMLGHTKISTTQLYSKVTVGKIAMDIGKLNYRV
jgi:integrase/recombinase XerD